MRHSSHPIDKSIIKKNLLTRLEKRKTRTPDIFEIRKYPHIPVFVYGTLKKGFSNHRLIEDAVYLGAAHTLSGTYNMKETGSFPVVYKDWDGVQKAHIRGEMYACAPEHVISMDVLESNGTMYQRHLVGFNCEDQEPKKERKYPFHFLKAWIYCAIPEYWDSIKIESLSTKKNPCHPKLSQKTFFEWRSEQGREENKLYRYIKRGDKIIDLFDKERIAEEERHRRNSEWMQSYGAALGFQGQFNYDDVGNWE